MRLTTLAALILGLPLLSGRYQEIESAETTTAAPETPAPGAGPITSTVIDGGGGSALGGAMRTANSIADRAEQHSADVANQADQD